MSQARWSGAADPEGGYLQFQLPNTPRYPVCWAAQLCRSLGSDAPASRRALERVNPTRGSSSSCLCSGFALPMAKKTALLSLNSHSFHAIQVCALVGTALSRCLHLPGTMGAWSLGGLQKATHCRAQNQAHAAQTHHKTAGRRAKMQSKWICNLLSYCRNRFCIIH